MEDKDFLNFISAQTTRGACVINFKTLNVSTQARAILEDTPYHALAKQHLNANIARGYYNNNKIKDKFIALAKEYNITIID